MILTINEEKKEFKEAVRLADLTDKKHYAALVNNVIRDLNYRVNEDANITFLDFGNQEAIRIYEGTLRYVLTMAINQLYPEGKVRFNYGISKSLFVELTNIDFKIDENITQTITDEMNRIIKQDLPINKLSIAIEEIINHYEKMGKLDRNRVLGYRKDTIISIYECNKFYNFMFSQMLPSTGYLSKFKLFAYYPFMMLQYPRSETMGRIPDFTLSPKYARTLNLAKKWSASIDCMNISDLNRTVLSENVTDFVSICEARHNRALVTIGDAIEKRKDEIKIIAVAGPTASGKTTFSNRLRIELLSRGIKPVMISLDDYYNHFSKAPKDIDGKPDLEHIEALDIDLFNRDMLNLILGNEVTLPLYDFVSKKRLKGKTVKLESDNVIIVEGIHALNERMTHLIPRELKYKIFISPQQQINIDDHNPIRITDIRLIRRTVRDHLFRNSTIQNTLSMWDSVRRGEFKWIYDYQEDADFIFNSELTYELCVLRKYALDLFSMVKPNEPNYTIAHRIERFLKYLKDIDEKVVPCDSILREFIGGSCY